MPSLSILGGTYKDRWGCLSVVSELTLAIPWCETAMFCRRCNQKEITAGRLFPGWLVSGWCEKNVAKIEDFWSSPTCLPLTTTSLHFACCCICVFFKTMLDLLSRGHPLLLGHSISKICYSQLSDTHMSGTSMKIWQLALIFSAIRLERKVW